MFAGNGCGTVRSSPAACFRHSCSALFCLPDSGLPINEEMLHAGLFDVVNGYTVVGGLTMVMLCLFAWLDVYNTAHDGDLQERARRMARRLLLPVAALFVVFGVMTYFMTDIFEKRGVVLTVLLVLALLAFLLGGYFMNIKRDGWAFRMTGAVIALLVTSVFVGLFPRVMVSSINSAFDLTIYNAASGPYSLKIMTIVAVSLRRLFWAIKFGVTSFSTNGYMRRSIWSTDGKRSAGIQRRQDGILPCRRMYPGTEHGHPSASQMAGGSRIRPVCGINAAGAGETIALFLLAFLARHGISAVRQGIAQRFAEETGTSLRKRCWMSCFGTDRPLSGRKERAMWLRLCWRASASSANTRS